MIHEYVRLLYRVLLKLCSGHSLRQQTLFLLLLSTMTGGAPFSISAVDVSKVLNVIQVFCRSYSRVVVGALF